MNREMRGLWRGGFAGAGEEAPASADLLELDDARSRASADPAELEPVGSVLAFIRVSVVRGGVGSGFVDHGLADLILLAGPIAKIEKAAAFAAEREVEILFRVDWLAADRAAPFHKPRITQKLRVVEIWPSSHSYGVGGRPSDDS